MGFTLPAQVEMPARLAGRLTHFINAWKVLTTDSWVLQTIKGFQIPFVGKPVQERRPRVPSFPSEQLAQVQEEVSSLLEKGAVMVVDSHPPQAEFYSVLFLVPKKSGEMRPVINLKALNQWVETPHFKMEGLSTLQDLLRQGDWLAKVDLKDAYLTVPVCPEHQCYLRFTIGEVNYQFTCLPFGLSCAPWAFTKMMKAVVTLLRSWGTRIIIYIDDILIMSESATLAAQHLEVLTHILKCLGFIINTEKSVMTPTQEIEFLGMVVNSNSLLVRLPADKLKQIRTEAGRISNMTSLPARLLSHFLGKLSATTQAVPPSPTILPLLAERSSSSPSSQQPGLRDFPVPLTGSTGRVVLVEGTPTQMEWETPQTGTGADNHQLRCFPEGLGSSLCRDTHRGCLVCQRDGHAHQFPGTACSHSSSEDLSKEGLRDLSTLATGQRHSGGIHQQHGGHSVKSADRTGKGTMDVGPGQEPNPGSPTHSRSVQYHSRCRIPNSQGQVRLDALPSNFSDHQESVRPTGCGPICLQIDTSATPLLQLETRSPSGSSGCIPAGLGPTEGVCQPPLVPDRQSPEPSTSPASSASAGSTSVEGPDLVPSAPGNVVGLSQTNCPDPGPDSAANRFPDGDGPSTSRVACLRERFSSSCLSEEATKLLLRSWRSKSAQSYDSHFRKWASWCAERGCDPVSGPASDVANFLAELHKEGYQSSSLNSFRSAISSAHDQVDGISIGKHPMICRVLKGAFNARPPLPRYTLTWSVETVLHYLESIGPSTSLSLKLLTFKLTMLLALTRPSRSADLASLQLDHRQFNPEGVVFLPAALAKQSGQGKPLKEFFFPSFPHNSELCPVETLRRYEAVTLPLRPHNTNRLFIALVKPHKSVTSATIARWLREVLRLSGIDVSIFSGHSVRGASTSAAAGVGITTNDILKAAD